MRIAFIVNNYPPRMGGVELHVQALATELARLGHTPFVVTLADVPAKQQTFEHGVTIITLPEHLRVAGILGFPMLGSRAKLTKWLRSEQIDIVSIHTRFFPMTYVGWRAAKHANVPTILTEHGSDHVQHPSKIVSLCSKAVDFTVGRASLRGATRVLGVSEESAAFASRLSRRDSEVFYNAIHAVSNPEPSLQHPERFVFVGRLVAGKGWELFIKTVHWLRSEGLPVSGDLLGDGPDRDAAEHLVRELDLDGVVTVHGRVDQASVRHFLSGATLVNPTTLSEGFQTTLLEAVASNAQILTFPVPGAESLRAQGASVTITSSTTTEELQLAALEVLKNPVPEQTKRFPIEEWTWPGRAAQYSTIIHEVVNQHSLSR